MRGVDGLVCRVVPAGLLGLVAARLLLNGTTRALVLFATYQVRPVPGVQGTHHLLAQGRQRSYRATGARLASSTACEQLRGALYTLEDYASYHAVDAAVALETCRLIAELQWPGRTSAALALHPAAIRAWRDAEDLAAGACKLQYRLLPVVLSDQRRLLGGRLAQAGAKQADACLRVLGLLVGLSRLSLIWLRGEAVRALLRVSSELLEPVLLDLVVLCLLLEPPLLLELVGAQTGGLQDDGGLLALEEAVRAVVRERAAPLLTELL